MYASQILMDEHKNILFMLDVLKKKCMELQKENPPSIKDLTNLVEFLKFYADAYHHGKEEDILFPIYEEAGVPNEQGPIGVMLREHVMGRGFIKEMFSAIEEMEGGLNSKVKFIENAQKYYELLQNHIHKEDNILYPMGDAKVSKTEHQNLSKKFNEFEEKKNVNVPKLAYVLATLNTYK